MPPTIPFAKRADLPIVGQPCKVHGWFPTVMLTCNCEAKTPLLIAGLGVVAQCDSCRRGFAIGTITHDQETGAGSVNIVTVAIPARPGAPS